MIPERQLSKSCFPTRAGSIFSKKGIKYIKRSGFCLETQFFPNSPNLESFPSTILEPGQKFNSKTSFKFFVERN